MPLQYHLNPPGIAVMLGLLFLLLPLAGYCDVAGQVKFATGKVESVAADGSRRALARGSEINSGDTINTAKDASVQIRFADGGFISLQPNSLFRVDEYAYRNKTDGDEKGFFSLLKGGLRAVSGAIGHVNRKTYRLTTPVATIGIRGTGYNAVLSDGLFVNVSEGAIALTNNAGTLIVNAGEAAFVANKDTPPALTNERPRSPAPSVQSIPDAQPAAGVVRPQPVQPAATMPSDSPSQFSSPNQPNSPATVLSPRNAR